MPSWRSVAVVAATLTGVLIPGVVHAAPPSNDDFDATTVITALPYTVAQDTTESTKATDDPAGCRGYSVPGSTWFTYTATESGLLRLTTEGSDRDLNVTTFTGVRGDLKQVWSALYDGCTTSRTTPITFPATAGTTYHFMVSGTSSPGGQVKLALDRISWLPNDDLANAERVSSLPFSAPQPDYTRASAEANEPFAQECGSGAGRPSVWYAYTPAQNQSVLMHTDSWGDGPQVAVYEGSSVDALTFLGCEHYRHYRGKAVALTAGKTYYFQWAGGGWYSSPSTLRLTEAAPLQTSVYSGDEERSIFEPVGFSVDHTNDYDDPVTTEWDFGDGTAAPPSTETHQSHSYAKDGVYTVTVRATSSDGRTATDTTTVTMKTHDVGITKFTVPTSARAEQQKTITVQVANTRYLEKPSVMLYRSEGTSWKLIGQADVEVPAHPTRKVSFPFAYTFTPEDAAIGKVTFRAVVQLPWPTKDARPMDNEVIALATTVRPALTTSAVINGAVAN
jgi:hypothetical protein